MTLGKYFRLKLRPIALTALFFTIVILLYFAFVPVLRNLFNDFPRRGVQSELDRLSSLQAFIAAIFSGNFGASAFTGDYLSKSFAARLPVTVLFIGIAIVLSIAMGVVAVLMVSLWKPKARKPQVFSYLFRSCLFAVAPLLGFFLIFVFYYQLNLMSWAVIYPRVRLISPRLILPDQIIGQLRYFILPSLTLGIIFLVRAVMVVWSSGVGSSVLSDNWAKRLFFAWKTTDFGLVISAVVLVEWVFQMPGVGQFMSTALDFSDYNGIIGVFIILLALSVILGYASTLIDYLWLRFYDLGEILEESEKQEAETRDRQKATGRKEFKKTLLSLLRRKGFMVGFFIVVVFVLLGLFAPIMTPYDPVYDLHLASEYAQPQWLPKLLNLNYSLNMNPVLDPGFSQQTSLDYWNITSDPGIKYQYDGTEGRPVEVGGSGPGSLSVIFPKKPWASFRMEYSFDYNYSSAPSRFLAEAAWRASTVSTGQSYQINVNLKTPVSSYSLYSSRRSSQDVARGWVVPETPLDSYYYANPTYEIFKVKGEYAYSVEILFSQYAYTSANIEDARIDLDDVNFTLFGDTFGLLGTDQRGRDIWSQLLYGTRTIFIIALPLAALGTLIGSSLGFITSRLKGWTFNVAMTIFDAIFFIPVLPFLTVLTVLPIEPQPYNGLLMSLPIFAAICANAFGNTHLVQSRKALKGNIRSNVGSNLPKDLLIGFSLTMMNLILVLPAIESFGLFDSSVASWGQMIYGAWNRGIEVPGLWLPPMIFAGLLALGFFLMGSGLEDPSEIPTDSEVTVASDFSKPSTVL